MTNLIRLGLTMLSAGILSAASPSRVESAPEADPLKRLMEGNKRYVDIKYAHPHQTKYRRDLMAKGQHPFAIVLSCSDSRVPPEVVFDRGLGDLFVVRVAGNIADDAAIGSIEYAAEHLHAPLLLVLGHERCGAVDATVKGGEVPGHIGSLTRAIAPAVEKAKGKPGDLLDNAVRANVEMVTAKLAASKPILAALVHEGKLKVAGARYDLDTGVVELLTGEASKVEEHEPAPHAVKSEAKHAPKAEARREAGDERKAEPKTEAKPAPKPVQPAITVPDEHEKPAAKRH
jgi:carbonic anhydrase